MKKILCLAITVAMILSFAAIPAFAADAATMTLAVTGDTGKVDDIITMTCTIKGVTTVYSWQCVFNYDSSVIKPYDSEYSEIITNSDDAVYALTSHVLNAATEGSRPKKYYGNTGVAFENNKFTVYASTAGGAAGTTVPVSADGYTVFTATFKRIATGDIGVALATGIEAPVVETTNLSGNVCTSSSIDYTAPGGSDEKWQDTISDTTTGDIKFPASAEEIGGTPTGTAPAKKVVVFAKNTSENALVGTATGTANYGITVGRSYYPGYLDVPAGSNWCIMLVDPDGSLLNGTYQVSVTVDGVTQTTTARTFGE